MDQITKDSPIAVKSLYDKYYVVTCGHAISSLTILMRVHVQISRCEF